MTYNEIMQKAGRKIKKNVFYYENNERIYLNENDIEDAKIWFDTNIIGTSMFVLDINLKNKTNQKEIYYEINAIYGNDKEQMIYGPYFLKEEPTYNASDKTYSYTYCDFFIKTMIDYKPINIPYPCKLQEFYDRLNETLGYTSSVSLINGDKILEYDIFSGINFTYRDVYTDIAQANGILLYADKLDIKEAKYTSEVITLNDDILKNINIDFGEHIGPYNTIVLSRSGDSDNIYIQDDESVELNGNIEFKISDNQLMNDNNRSDYLPGLLEKIKGLEFDTFDVEITGFGGFEPLQKVEFITGDNKYYSYVLANEMIFTDGFSENLSTPIPEETTTDYSVSDKTDKRINQAYIIVNKQNQKINLLTGQVEDYQEKVSKIEQTVDGITQKVEAVYDFTRIVEGNNKVKVEELQENGILELRLKGEIQQIIVSENTIVSNNTILKEPILIFKNDKEKHQVYLPINYLNAIEIESKIISDEFVWELVYDEDNSNYVPQAKIIRRLNTEKKPLFQPYEEKIDGFDINIQKGSYDVYLESFNGLDYYIKYAILNEVTDQFATKTNLSSAITQTSTSINQEVNAKIEGVNKEVNAKLELKVNTDELISEINASADIIRINTGRFILRGQNCSINEQGIFSAVGGKFSGNITGGTINIESSNSVIATFTDTLNKKSTKLNGSSIMIDDTELNSSGIRAIDGGYNSVYYADAVEMHYGSSYTRITAIDGVTHSSKEEYKKNIEEKTGCLKLVKNAKIYSYLFKEENNNSKKHIGLVIGNNYNNPEEVLNKAKDGIELYNMVGILWQAVRELTEKVEKLERNNKDV